MFYVLLFSRSFRHFDLDFFLESLQRKFAFLFDPDGILFLQNLCDIRFCYVHSGFFFPSPQEQPPQGLNGGKHSLFFSFFGGETVLVFENRDS